MQTMVSEGKMKRLESRGMSMRPYSSRSRASPHLPGSGASIRSALAADGGQPRVRRVNYVRLCPHSGTALKMNETRAEGDVRDLIERDLFMTDTQVLPSTGGRTSHETAAGALVGF